MSNAKRHTRPHVAVRVVVTARPAAWQRGSAAALEINENEGHSTPLSARPSGLRSVPGMQRAWARAVPGACFGFIRSQPFSVGMCLERRPNADVLRQRSGVYAQRKRRCSCGPLYGRSTAQERKCRVPFVLPQPVRLAVVLGCRELTQRDRSPAAELEST